MLDDSPPAAAGLGTAVAGLLVDVSIEVEPPDGMPSSGPALGIGVSFKFTSASPIKIR
jgi:hypothetical protein